MWIPGSGSLKVCGFHDPDPQKYVDPRIRILINMWIPGSGSSKICGSKDPDPQKHVDLRILILINMWIPGSGYIGFKDKTLSFCQIKYVLFPPMSLKYL